MVNYLNGKIYAIRSANAVYIGSTTKDLLCKRLAEHRSYYSMYKKGTGTTYLSSFKVLQYDDYRIELIEAFPCSSRNELVTREYYHIQLNPCVNCLGQSQPYCFKKKPKPIVDKLYYDVIEKNKIEKHKYQEFYKTAFELRGMLKCI